MNETVLALDAGQTGIKARLVRDGAEPFELVLDGVRTDRPILPQLADAARAVAAQAGAGAGEIGTVAIGTSGLTSAEADAAPLRALLADLAPGRILLAHDSVTSYLGTLGDAQGAVVASGTGVVTLAVGPAAVARVDGWGYLMGDAGSGFWIGRQVLEAVMRAHDGRGPATALTAVVLERWPVLEDAYVQLQSDEARVSAVASFARHVAELAATDDVAARICDEAASELALSVVTALRRVQLDAATAPLVSAIGGVLRSARIRAAFEDEVSAVFPDAVFEAPHGTGIDGAVALAALPDAHPLRAHVSAA